jgi:thioesterase domain-containing protein
MKMKTNDKPGRPAKTEGQQREQIRLNLETDNITWLRAQAAGHNSTIHDEINALIRERMEAVPEASKSIEAQRIEMCDDFWNRRGRMAKYTILNAQGRISSWAGDEFMLRELCPTGLSVSEARQLIDEARKRYDRENNPALRALMKCNAESK